MADKPIRGLPSIYDECCDGSFYEYILSPYTGEILPGLLCEAPVWYTDQEMYVLSEDKYNSYYEEESTWKISKCHDLKQVKQIKHKPYKILNLESEEQLAVVKFKHRPVIALKKINTDWKQPQIPTNSVNYWLCLPIFSYKDRHSQVYVLRDQALLVTHRFYFPKGIPGIENEGVGKITQIRCIPEMLLETRTCYCPAQSREKPVRLSQNALNAVSGHVAALLPNIELTGEAKDFYDFFKELASTHITEIAKLNKISL